MQRRLASARIKVEMFVDLFRVFFLVKFAMLTLDLDEKLYLKVGDHWGSFLISQ